MKSNKKPSFKEESILWEKGVKLIVGLDEVGRGAFAGPLVAAAVILPQKFNINGIKDSKLLTAKKRQTLSEYIKKSALDYYISTVEIPYINEHGIGKAVDEAFRKCLKGIKNYDFVLVDGFKIKNFSGSQKGIIHGDMLSVSIAAASIIAKVYRDNLMIKLHKSYPVYNFLENKGYGTKYHRDVLKKNGMSEIHRSSFNLSRFLPQA